MRKVVGGDTNHGNFARFGVSPKPIRKAKA